MVFGSFKKNIKALTGSFDSKEKLKRIKARREKEEQKAKIRLEIRSEEEKFRKAKSKGRRDYSKKIKGFQEFSNRFQDNLKNNDFLK